MSQTVFDILTSGHTSEEIEELQTPGEKLVQSIRNHLQRMLNARRCSLAHLPHYGMPDIAELYLGLPYSRDKIMAGIRQCIEDFEPRLVNPNVRAINLDNGKDVTQFEIVGESPGGHRLKYVTSLFRNGSIKVATAGEYFSHG
jgi:type VI secretion system protein